MSNCSKYQNNYWYPKVANRQHGEYCAGCGISHDSKNFVDSEGNLRIVNLVLDKINNDGNHTIKDNVVSDFQLLCISCNRMKNPSRKPDDSVQTQSEKTNQRAEKPLIEWALIQVKERKSFTWASLISEGSLEFDISPETIERRYYKKYFAPECIKSPLSLAVNEREQTIVVLRARESKSNLDIDTHTPPLVASD